MKELNAKIQAWKAEHGKVFKTVIDGEDYIWRKLKRKEYVMLMANKSEEEDLDARIYERQEEIAKLVVLFPENISELVEENAGLSTTIADEVIARSGFGITETQEL